MICLALIALLAFQPAIAQPPRAYFPWWDQPLTKDLNLTPAQRQKIRATVHEYRDKLIQQRAAVQKAEIELEDVFDNDTIDAPRAFAAVENLARARENLTRTFAEMALRLRMVLTNQQWRELQKRRRDQSSRGRPTR
jgi:Spy/CpxP family protein refolding chaperone